MSGQMSASRNVVTLEQFIIERQADFEYASGELSHLLRDIGLAARIINREVSKAGLVDILGITGNENASGEEVKKLDVFAHQGLPFGKLVEEGRIDHFRTSLTVYEVPLPQRWSGLQVDGGD